MCCRELQQKGEHMNVCSRYCIIQGVVAVVPQVTAKKIPATEFITAENLSVEDDKLEIELGIGDSFGELAVLQTGLVRVGK